MKHFFARSGGRNQIIPGFGLSMGMTLTMLSSSSRWRRSWRTPCS
ncbi:hypothetical protein [Megasphaera sp.]